MKNPINPKRVHRLNNLPATRGEYVIYWMQQTQRAEFNPALEYAIWRANELNLPLVVVFGITKNYPEANLRHFRFMLEGLCETKQRLAERQIKMLLRWGEPPDVALQFAEAAACIICDRGYLRHQRAWRNRVAKNTKCSVDEVEGDVIAPVDIVSAKQEFAARTIRPKIHRVYEDFLEEVPPQKVRCGSTHLPLEGLRIEKIAMLERELDFDDDISPVSGLFTGGTQAAKSLFSNFLANLFDQYSNNRNQPQTDNVSHMSKYLHFGHISPVWLLLEARRHASKDDQNLKDFTEELLVRRELAINYVRYNHEYDCYESLPDWARRTLDEHRNDQRSTCYSYDQLDNAQTHDAYWNAAMLEMKHTGYMHNYMRMYWGKKILEWTPTPEEAYRRTLKLNNKYFLDGRDPVSFASAAWVFGLHDRPWGERPVFGKIRYMNAKGLKRKCDIEGYVKKVKRLVKNPN